MFDPRETPRVFGLPPGADFPRALAEGVLRRLAGQPPEAVARVEIYVNTRRMQRRLKALFAESRALLLPRIRLVTDLAQDPRFGDIPPAVPKFRRQLELSQLVGKLLEAQPEIAPRSALFDLSGSLASLMDEMQGEGVAPGVLQNLDVSDQSGHWQRTKDFVALVDRYFGPEGSAAPDPEARQRLVVERLASQWAEAPPTHPIIVAGSTGSRGATAVFMQAVAKLPVGAVVLPGVDFDLPASVWNWLAPDERASRVADDHPQYRFWKFMNALGRHPKDIEKWNSSLSNLNHGRNRLVSLALRPAPVTDQWMTEGRKLTGVSSTTEKMTLIEAQSPRHEASAISLVLRQAVEDGKVAALITPNRTLTRQVTAALDRWGIVPDDSAGRPLALSAPGRFLRHVAALWTTRLTSEALLTLLKHPLTNSGSEARGQHLLHTRELELRLRRRGPPFPTGADLLKWAEDGDEDRKLWATWLAGLIARTGADTDPRSLSSHLARHLEFSESLAAGPAADGSGELWLKAAGNEAAAKFAALQSEASYGGLMSAMEFSGILGSVLAQGEVREAELSHSGVMIWGTLEARVQGADVVVLGGLNEGVWPEAPRPDPWLNRSLRAQAGLLLPEREIGLAAHDFQQAVAAECVVLSRSTRDSEAQTVPSRWLNRLTNLLAGVSEEGATALDQMRLRGAHYLAMAQALEAPTAQPAAARPSPRPPAAARPREITITEVQRLIRDPYAVYASRVLVLQALDPIRHDPDAPLRGTVIHKIVERFILGGPVTDLEREKTRFLEVATSVLEQEVPWPATRRLWRAQIANLADWLVNTEMTRQHSSHPFALERKGRLELSPLPIDLVGKIDRIDRILVGGLAVYDYKTGKPPTQKQRDHFDKQLLLSCLLAQSGAVDGVAAELVTEAAYVALGSEPKIETIRAEQGDIEKARSGLLQLLSAYAQPGRGYTSRRAMERLGYSYDFDHLARLGEWDESDPPTAVEVG